jgi:hypothetical protein
MLLAKYQMSESFGTENQNRITFAGEILLMMSAGMSMHNKDIPIEIMLMVANEIMSKLTGTKLI